VFLYRMQKYQIVAVFVAKTEEERSFPK
jgi:hypothetical protein